MILVAGGTGRLGSLVVRRLSEAGSPVRLMARGTSAPFPANQHDGVERVRGDLASAADCDVAVAGCSSVVFAASGFGLARGGSPRTVDRDGAVRLLQAATRAGVGHCVMLSMHGAADGAPLEFLRMKHAAEVALMSSGLDWTVVRIGPILEQFVEVVGAPLAARGKALVFGSGRAPITFTASADAAGLVLEALANPGLRGRTVDWGSATMTLGDLAEALIVRAGGGSVQRIPTAALRVMSVAARPFSPFMARMAQAGLWMETGAARFQFSPARAEFPDVPVTGLGEVLGV
jgi:uncharacterized protein YbjT (DUF2867 family)